MTQSEQDALGQGVSQEFIDTERAKGKAGLLHGSNVDPQDVGGLVSAFKLNTNPYSSTNITGAVTSPTAPPDYNDPLGYLSRLNGELGVTDAQKTYNDAINGLRQFDQGTTNQYNFLENQTVSNDVIRGEQANQGRLRSAQRTSMADAAQANQDYLLAKKDEVQQRYGIYQQNREMMTNLILQNPGAKIKYTDTVEQAQSKLEKYSQKVADDQKKEALKSMAMAAGLKSSGSAKEIRDRLSKAAKKDKELKTQMDQLDLKYKQAQISDIYSTIKKRGSGGDDKIQNEFDKYVQDIADKVDAGDLGSREDAYRAIERRYPGEGSIIYRLIPDKVN